MQKKLIIASMMVFIWEVESFLLKDMHHSIRLNSIFNAKYMIIEWKTAQEKSTVRGVLEIMRLMSAVPTARRKCVPNVKDHM